MTFTGPMSDIVDNTHSLLEPPSPAYSNVTVRRAFIVWMYCGQRNKFKDVCNYFHYLEALEDQLSPERRANSRHHEFTLFSKQPPTSEYLIDNFPQLYKESCIKKNCTSKVEEIRHENSVFKLEGFNEIAPKKGTTTQEIVEASRMIREFCRIQMISLKKFLEEFKQHASKCGLSYTVTNVASYIKRKMVQAEIELEANYTKTLGFLIGNSAENIFNGLQVNTVSNNGVGDVKTKSVFKKAGKDKNFKPIKILRKDDATAIEGTKNIWNTKTNTEFNNTLGFGEIKTEKDNVFDNEKYLKDRTFLDDLTDDNIELKKERRFSGSYLMKMELEKFRKI